MGVESGETPAHGGLPGPGAMIAGKYRVDKVLATGGMGTILQATHLALEQRVAIKILLPEVAGKAEFVERFLREARASVGLRGEHAVRVFDVGTLSSGSPYMVMEYLRGHDLANEVQKRGPLPVAEAVDYVLQACEALAEAHQLGIVHRDLKPANLFLARQPDSSRRVKVLDFGISKRIQERGGLVKDQGLTVASTLLGSPQYMSPEQVRNIRTIDGRADIWALGVVLYELLTDATPFSGDTVSAIAASIVADEPYPLEKLRPTVPSSLRDIVYRCLEKRPEKRFLEIAELVEALLPFAPEHSRPSLDRVRNIARGPRSGNPDSDYPSADSIPLMEPAPLSQAETVAMPGASQARVARSKPPEPSELEPGTFASTPAGVESTNLRQRRYLIVGAAVALALVLVGTLGLRRRTPNANAGQEGAQPAPIESAPDLSDRNAAAPLAPPPIAAPVHVEQSSASNPARPLQTREPAPARRPTSQEPTKAPAPALKVNDPLDDRK